MRDPQPIERFSESDYSEYTEYELSRVGVRHDRVTDEDIDEARSTEPSLAAELDSLFSRVRAAASATCGADPTSELVGEMERTAATLLHAALVECLAAAGMDEEVAHIWAGDGTASAAFTVAATMPDPSRPSLSQPGVRLSGLKFAPGPGGPQDRQMRSGVTKLYYLSRDGHHSILAC